MANYFSQQSQNNTNQVRQQGNDLQQQFQNQGNAYGQQAGYYATNGTQAYNTNGQGGQGYTPQQASGILQQNASGTGLQGVSPLTQDQYQSWNYSPAQQQAIMGNPQQVAANTQANNAQLGTYMAQNSQNLQGTANQGASTILGSVNPNAFNLDPNYRPSINQALGTESSTLNGAANNPNLGLSNQFNQNYTFGPQDMQNVVTAAGNTVGAQYQSSQDAAARQAAASGSVSPLAVAAAQENMQRQGSVAAGQAMAQAQLAAKAQQLGVTQTAEQMRLGTAQDIASRQMQAGESLAGTQIGAQNSMQQMALNAAQAGQGLGLSAAGQAANVGLTGAEQVANLQNNATQFATGANLQAGEYANTNAQTQAALLAQNQQALNEYGQNAAYGQGMGVNQQMSNTSAQVANMSQAEQMAYANALFQEQNPYLSAEQNAGSQQLGAYGTSGQLLNQGQLLGYNEQNPSIWSTLLGAGLGAAGAFLGA